MQPKNVQRTILSTISNEWNLKLITVIWDHGGGGIAGATCDRLSSVHHLFVLLTAAADPEGVVTPLHPWPFRCV